jgi:DNA-binding response OmpR family regulator
MERATEQPPAILLVEDDEDDLFLIQRSMQRSRLVNPVQVLPDGEQAVQYLAGEGQYEDRGAHPMPFLILLDLHMPKLSGFEVISWIRQRRELDHVTVAVLTSSSDERDWKKAMELGADSYFVKPGSLDEFVSLMLRIHGHWMMLDGQETSPRVSVLR